MMNVNPMKLMQLKNGWSQFKLRHPKLPRFLAAVSAKAMQEDSVLELSVTMPDGETMASNIRLTAEDIVLFQDMMEVFGDGAR